MIHKNTKIVALTSLTFFVMCLGGLIGFSYMIEQKKETQVTFKRNVAEARARKEALTALVSIVDTSLTQRAQLRSYILEDDQVINFLSRIETLGRERGVVIKTDNLIIQPLNNAFEDLQVTISMEGQYDVLLKLIKLIEVLPYQISVTRVHMEKSGEKEGSLWKSIVEVHVTKFKKI